ncbi:DJ-1/PfpI family protein [Lasiosphaeria ovina]|uniref:DJ-1/PfpI family protein n=1 Tax=Lasiosphaeria ovina TaxID=92902 RepID=A0AAE0K7K3_9PEZI|nr:DJ-1/PfpI family protein [Lasiosphaeria ovina]
MCQALRPIALLFLSLLTPTLARPKLPPLPSNTTFPTHYAVVVWPSFALGDAFGPIDVLNALTYWYPQLGMHLSVLSATLDPVSTRLLAGSVVPDEANATVLPPGDFGQAVLPTDTLAAVLARNGSAWVEPYPPDGVSPPNRALAPIDVLLVPGGAALQRDRSAEAAFVRALYPRLRGVFSVCTGAAVLARAGVLGGRRATSSKQDWRHTVATPTPAGEAAVRWVREARWVRDGNVWTAAGPTAGIDAMYAWVESVFGRDVAEYLADAMEHVRWRDGDYNPFADVWDE